MDKSKLTALHESETVLSKYDVIKLQNWGVEDMRIHLYISWEGIENYKQGKPFFAWRENNKIDSDLHVDVNLDYYHIEELDTGAGDIKLTKKTQSEIMTDTINTIKFK